MPAIPSQYRGIAWLLTATVIFTGTNTLAKLLGERVDLIQIVWGRYLFHFLVLALLLNIKLPTVLRTKNLKLQVARSFLLLLSSTLYFGAFIAMPLADAAALLNLAPVVVTLLAIPLLGERVGIRRIMGVLAGLAGALIIIRPGVGAINPAAWLPISAAVTYAVYQVATRRVSHVDGPTTSVTYTAIAGSIVCSAAVPFYWSPIDGLSWVLLVSIGLTGALGHYAMIRAYTVSEASAVAPFAYAILIWMTFAGILVFDDVPDIWTIVGASVIAGSGIYIARREKARTVASSETVRPPAHGG